MEEPQEVANAETLERPSQVADRLGISTAMLRRHVASYEGVFGPLPASKRDGRLYSGEVVERLGAALALYHAGRAASVEEALRRLATGEQSPGEAIEAARAPDTMTLLLEELRLLRLATERQNELLQAQGERLKALEASSEQSAELERQRLETELPQRRGWWARVFRHRS